MAPLLAMARTIRKCIIVYKFDNTKESWHEFALKFRVIAGSSEYEDIIDGTKCPSDKKRKP